MSSWIITIPKTTKWSDYVKELAAVADGSQILNYKTRYIPKGMSVGDRCYIVNDGLVRGWMTITGLKERKKQWVCSTTNTGWPPGRYIQRSGKFHGVEGVVMAGFRGVRRYTAE